MMVVLDTNHFTEFVDASIPGQRLMDRINECEAEVFTCIVAAEETLQGWLALLRSRRAGRDQLEPYARLKQALEALSKLVSLPFDAEAAETFHKLQKNLPQMGTMDLKIASICLAHDVTLLTRNLRDFQMVPDLKVENWLD